MPVIMQRCNKEVWTTHPISRSVIHIDMSDDTIQGDEQDVVPAEEQGEEAAAEDQLAAEEPDSVIEEEVAVDDASGVADENEVAIEDEPVIDEEMVEVRDASVPVESTDLLTEQETIDRVNYLVEHPEERTAHDPFSADGQKIGLKDGAVG